MMGFSRLKTKDLQKFRALMQVFADAFDDRESYLSKAASDDYVLRLLGKENMVFLVAEDDNKVIGGLVAYVLEKFEQERAEVYIYDLAVHACHRRKKVATGLIEKLKRISEELGAWVMFVQADYIDPPAIALYESLGKREEVLHFDIEIE